ncbi:TetR/AcrR family transcriptional regulator [Zafaria sp. J156]|uniref:TetR/AcrR family transcriptional regulator n=1 Tax=Zafaria sp. J156 TaxID=3116490 RepID=UPI002E782D43|nr:TetR/AcrR family transcriptional regulator [Zafaria sp. J156]MEE1622398.1 TetR/AcrR family transcriptional regulator [Zafaria sp. J156]
MNAREPLSRERVVEAAVAVADRGGLAAASMRGVAAELGVEAMSLYHHVAGKDALLDALVDWVFARIELPGERDPWRPAMAARAASARSVLAAHPWALGLIESRRVPGPALLAHHNAVLGNLRANGFPVRLAAHAFSALDSYVYGFVLTELNLPFDAAGDGANGEAGDGGGGGAGREAAAGRAAGAGAVGSGDAGRETGGAAADFAEGLLDALAPYPHLLEMVGGVVSRRDYAYADEFAPGLELILDSLERRLEG